MQLNDVLIKTTKNKKRIGRGGNRGTTAGRGTKGQKARAGHKIRPAIRDLIKRIPKKRGVKFTTVRPAKIVVDFDMLEKNFVAGEKITPRTLARKNLISLPSKKTQARVKILSRGKLTKKFIFENVNVSSAAAVKIMELGGEIRHVKK